MIHLQSELWQQHIENGDLSSIMMIPSPARIEMFGGGASTLVDHRNVIRGQPPTDNVRYGCHFKNLNQGS